jgi:hypothetical protein
VRSSREDSTNKSARAADSCAVLATDWENAAKASKLSLGDSTMTRPDSDAVDYQCCTSLGNWPRGRTSRRVGPSINPSWLGEPRSETLAERTRTCTKNKNRKESKWATVASGRTWRDGRISPPRGLFGVVFSTRCCAHPHVIFGSAAVVIYLGFPLLLCLVDLKGLCVDALLKPTTGHLALHRSTCGTKTPTLELDL